MGPSMRETLSFCIKFTQWVETVRPRSWRSISGIRLEAGCVGASPGSAETVLLEAETLPLGSQRTINWKVGIFLFFFLATVVGKAMTL